MSDGVSVRIVDWGKEADARAVVEMTRMYAMDPMARGEDLPEDVKSRLAKVFSEHPASFCFLAWEGDRPVGIANCVFSFSSFRAKKLVNLHDLAVVPDMRGQGVSSRLIQAVEDYARQNDCAGVTLEVYESNEHARDVYDRLGFSGARPGKGEATLFCFKEL